MRCMTTFPTRIQVYLFICDRSKNGMLHNHLEFSGITLYETTPCLALSPSLWSSRFCLLRPLFSLFPAASSSLPCVSACFRAWQEAQIWGLKLDQIFSRYRFLTVPGFFTSSTQLLSITPSARPSLESLTFAPLSAVANKVVRRSQTYTHSHRQPRTYAHGES